MAKKKNYFWKVVIYFPDNTTESALADNVEKYIAHIAQTRFDWVRAEVRDELFDNVLREIHNDSQKGGDS